MAVSGEVLPPSPPRRGRKADRPPAGAMMIADYRGQHMAMMDSNGVTHGELTRVAYYPPAKMTLEEWIDAGRVLQAAATSIQWWVGDWLNHGEAAYGEKYAQGIEITGMAYGTLANWASVAKAFPPERRNADVQWSSHAILQGCEPAVQDAWLAQAAKEGWTTAALEKAMKETSGEPPEGDAPILVNCTACGGTGKVKALLGGEVEDSGDGDYGE